MRKVLYAIAGLIGIFLLVGLALPRYTRVESGIRIDAYPATVFALVNDFRRVELWSPWFAADPNLRIVHSGPLRGTGATMTWDGAVIGTGAQTITDSRPFERVTTSFGGDTGDTRTWFDLAAVDEGTNVTWGFETDYGLNVARRYAGLFIAGVIERDLGKGLDSLRDLAETLPKADFSDVDIEHLVVEATDIAYLSTVSAPEPAAVSEAMGDAYFEILGFIDAQGLTEAGAPMSVTRSFGGSEIRFDSAIPVRGVSDATPRSGARVRIGTTYAGHVIRAKHIGPYRTLGETHRKIAAYLAALGIERAGDHWESYVSDPTRVPEPELLTYIYYPVSST